MSTPLEKKSTIHDIRERFDNDVERFSNLETGQTATMDAPLAMELITQAAISSTSPIRNVLDPGCGAGNNTIKLRQSLTTDFDAVLLDLSQPMLTRAAVRLSAINHGRITMIAEDFRTATLERESFDVILCAAVLHHLRDDNDWRTAFQKLYGLLRPGGSVWITDMVIHEAPAIHGMMWARYGQYLTSLRDDEYRDNVFAYIDREDSPRPVTYQLELLRSVGFRRVELLHKNCCFAAFGAIKDLQPERE
jgi:tRNA (cmo5U34)-methyltransferase